jgi:Mrp family chromosome partitioning ATPase
MVERLKEAIEKARQRRTEDNAAPPSVVATAGRSVMQPADWSMLSSAPLDPAHLARQRVVAYGCEHAAYVTFDMLRTRLFKTCADNGWSRIAITSPTKGCGKSLVAMNLAFSVARSNKRVLLVDLDLKNPSSHRYLGLPGSDGISRLLLSTEPVTQVAVRLTDNFAACLGGQPLRNSAETLLAPQSVERLQALHQTLKPDVTLFDLPPMLSGDDVMAMQSSMDGLLLVAGAGQTTADDILECERLIDADNRLLGVVLNKVADMDHDIYANSYVAS